MKAIEEFPKLSRIKNRRAGRYDYGTLFNGKVWELTRDVDFKTKPSSVATCLKIKAKQLGLNVRIVTDATKVFVQKLDNEVPATV